MVVHSQIWLRGKLGAGSPIILPPSGACGKYDRLFEHWLPQARHRARSRDGPPAAKLYDRQ
jgi:hypothetical protein